MVETVYDLCQPSMFATSKFTAKPGSSFFFPLGNLSPCESNQANVKVIKIKSELKPSYFPKGSFGKKT